MGVRLASLTWKRSDRMKVLKASDIQCQDLRLREAFLGDCGRCAYMEGVAGEIICWDAG